MRVRVSLSFARPLAPSSNFKADRLSVSPPPKFHLTFVFCFSLRFGREPKLRVARIECRVCHARYVVCPFYSLALHLSPSLPHILSKD